ncbi:MAG: bifunctional N(6)-L-threonylcarbamoyladenine synthase/serine/threonine protein kinase [Nanoarchaeota archaeon]|nr:bifunctional N(6)-L-threonylcarbamoyladenine synthase/serine/threonine protein kinase [Nanoarchaeota archaeon]MBU1270187.1 bifunctional N(6)-L-threonylcarbamoyladenine synthase/serine/threonine protein kinase [Nanoarchaeota archaeon]MBU1604443.1 bifunctional N(6)-L-threonylcarbamoyladenine synthase/serine/threonine protein kinase [Nanoarchaeota archaeon]MBU2443563.1 bifunctional N(6)-L-threonylcarbamoyladenine synthase/serine/threonine protein kinase [Nanoarchaeota archaeon]
MITIGIESTAHTFGVAILRDDKVLSNVKDSYTTKSGGMIPGRSADHHVDVCDVVLKNSLEKSGVKLSEVDIIAFSQGPGIGHCLRIGAVFARSLSILLKKPLVGVNHCIAHLEIGRLSGATDPILLYASGANTQIIAYDGGKYRIFGETLDIGIGNLLDTVGRALGLGFPAGPTIEKFAKGGKKYVPLPYAVKGMDVSFGGLHTNLKHKIQSGKFSKEDLCYSLQETVFAMLVEVSERAMAHCEKKELVLGGGVACNSRLKEMANIMCSERGAKCFIPQNQFLVDNAAMIGLTGYLMFKAGNKITVEDSAIRPYERTDDVEVNWR